MNFDTDNFGTKVDLLVGKLFQRTLALDSLKLRFANKEKDSEAQFIWIDAPWLFLLEDDLITKSGDYSEKYFEDWSRNFDVINHRKLVSWEIASGGVVIFNLNDGYRIEVPSVPEEIEEDYWYVHWYAT